MKQVQLITINEDGGVGVSIPDVDLGDVTVIDEAVAKKVMLWFTEGDDEAADDMVEGMCMDQDGASFLSDEGGLSYIITFVPTK